MSVNSFSLFKSWRVWLVTLYFLAALSWTMPAELFPLKTQVNSVTSYSMNLFSLGQAWDMFAPEPRRIDIFCEVLYTDRDGSQHRWPVSRMVTMSYYDRWQKERWRKYFNDHLRNDVEQKHWQPFTQYAVRRLRTEGHDPIEISLVRWWRQVDPIIRPELRAGVNQNPWFEYEFYKWRVPDHWEKP